MIILAFSPDYDYQCVGLIATGSPGVIINMQIVLALVVYFVDISEENTIWESFLQEKSKNKFCTNKQWVCKVMQ